MKSFITTMLAPNMRAGLRTGLRKPSRVPAVPQDPKRRLVRIPVAKKVKK